MFVQDAVIMLVRLTIELRSVTIKLLLSWRHAVCSRSMSNICGTAWGKFTRIIAISIPKHVSHSNPGKAVFNASASSVLLYGSEA